MYNLFRDISAEKWIISIIYTSFVLFLLVEKFLADYYYHNLNAFRCLNIKEVAYILLISSLPIILIFISFHYGKLNLAEIETIIHPHILNEITYAGLVLYLAYALGLFRGMPFREFLVHIGVYVIFSAVIYLGYNLIMNYAEKGWVAFYKDWFIGGIIIAIVCLGFFRAEHDYITVNFPTSDVENVRYLLRYWKDIALYTAFGAIIMQGVYRFTLAYVASGPSMAFSNELRVIVFVLYCLIAIGVFLILGYADVRHINSREVHELSPYLRTVVEAHIFIRDIPAAIFILLNGIWIGIRLFVKK